MSDTSWQDESLWYLQGRGIEEIVAMSKEEARGKLVGLIEEGYRNVNHISSPEGRDITLRAMVLGAMALGAILPGSRRDPSAEILNPEGGRAIQIIELEAVGTILSGERVQTRGETGLAWRLEPEKGYPLMPGCYDTGVAVSNAASLEIVQVRVQ